MQVTAGSRLGPYEIVAPIGAGGLGEVAQRTGGQEAVLLFLCLADDLRQGDRGEVLFGLVVGDLDVVAVADHRADLIERDVPAVLRIVELSVRVTLDDPRVRHLFSE